MSDTPERFELASQDPLADRRAVLRSLCPEVFQEDQIDVEALRRTLGDWVESGPERFGLTWPGKAECMRVIQEPSIGTLAPMLEESVDFDATQNVIIEGENLEVLKLLQKAYYGKVKFIYIDPPYNTGKEFIYPDNFREGLTDYLRYSGQVDEEGLRLSANAETDGRYHSKWLSMMYPRLFLARNLLREDGVIFVSIDDHEVHNLRAIMNEIFGEENFIATLVWEKGRKNDAKRFSVGHEYLLGYSRNLSYIEELLPAWREPKEGVGEIVEEYLRLKAIHGSNYDSISAGLVDFYRSLPDGHPSANYSRSRFVDARGIWRDNNISWPGGGGPKYEVLHPITHKPCVIPADGWRFIEQTMKQRIAQGYVHFREDHTKPPILKSYLYIDEPESESKDDVAGEKLQVMGSVFYRHTQPENDVLKDLFGEKIFENPKDHSVLARLIRYCTSSDDLVLDFFAGSGSTAHAVLELNAREASHRHFLLVQLPEPTNRDDYPTIADITRERVKRAGAKIQEGAPRLDIAPIDAGFRAFRLTASNFNIWNSSSASSVEVDAQLAMSVDHVAIGTTAQSMLAELLLKAGYALTAPVEDVDFAGVPGYSVADAALLVCLSGALSIESFEAMVGRDPAMILVLDSGFGGNDELKVNAVQTVRARNQQSGSDIALRVV
jgi:adenine-specific DNA-methyltransferase